MSDLELERAASEIFESAVGLAAAERETLLDRACAGRPDLRRRVDSLLEHSGRLGDFLDQPLVGAPRDEEATDPWLGRRLGPYLLTELLGEGGMGRVYRALRAEPVRMEVAVKIMSGFAGEEGRRRFEVERRVLAELRDPRIAALLDGGTTDDGAPYLVMELVAGAPITDYCDHHGVGVAGRIRIFVEVCQTVAVAHSRLVVHRDIKPSNVLVSATGSPYLLDFGIAKLLEPDGAFPADTRTGLRLLTPSYASPEQLVGEPVSTASDVYSLGVLLFELLTGALPRDRRQLAADLLAEPAKWRDAPLASEVVARTVAAGPSATAELRCGLPARALGRLLRGDLDAILERALRRAPEERYASPRDLAADLERYLAGEPVHARTRSRWYRARKLLTRHPRASLAAIAGVLALVVFGISSRYQLLAVRGEQAAAEAARREAEQVTEILLESFEVASTPRAQGGLATARRVVDQGVERAAGLAAYPDLQASVRHTVAEAYDHLGLHEEARGLFEQALAARRARLGSDAPAVLATLLASVSPLRELGELAEAERRGRAVLAARSSTLGPDHVSTAEAQVALATVLLAKADAAAAERLVSEALRIHRAATPPDPRAIVDDLHFLGQVQQLQARYPLAERSFRQALELLGGTGEAETRAHGRLLFDLAATLVEQAKLAEAEPLFRQAVSLQARVLEPDHPDVATFRDGYGVLLLRQGRYAQALGEFDAALAIRRRVYGEEHAGVAEALGHRAQVLYAEGRIGEAEGLFRRTLAIRRAVLPEEHPLIAEALNNLAVTLEPDGRWRDAETLYREALAIHRRALGPGHPQVALELHNLGWAVWNRGDAATAGDLFREALTVCRALATPPPPECSYDLDKLAWLSRRANELPEAERLAREALGRRVEALGEPHPETGQSRLQLAACLAVAGRAEEARREADRTADDFAEAFPPDHWLTGYVSLVRGLARASLGEAAGAGEAERGYRLVASAWAPGSIPQTDAAGLLELARRRLAAASRQR